MIQNTSRGGIKRVSEKTMAEICSENWAFYDPPSSLKILSASEISKETAKLKQIMQERNQLAIYNKMSGQEGPKQKKKQEAIWNRSPSKTDKQKWWTSEKQIDD